MNRSCESNITVHTLELDWSALFLLHTMMRMHTSEMKRSLAAKYTPLLPELNLVGGRREVPVLHYMVDYESKRGCQS